MAQLELRGIEKRYGTTISLAPTDLDVAPGEFVTVLGPSGCGKSTLLRTVAGVLRASGGEIWLDGTRIDTSPPERRNVAMVFQSYALLPHLTVRRNIEFGPRMRHVACAERERRLHSAVALCRLDALLDRYPRQLSGGQQQRVALARAIAAAPKLMLFDEPLSNLDAKLREELRRDLTALHRRLGGTSLYVTHDRVEAMTMSDRVVVMKEGRVIESGTPQQLYLRPRTDFVARFLGHPNLTCADCFGTEAHLPWGRSARLVDPMKGAATVTIRPDQIALRADQDAAGHVSSCIFAGERLIYTIAIAGLELEATLPPHAPQLAVGTRVRIDIDTPIHALERAS